jgi:phospholipase C
LALPDQKSEAIFLVQTINRLEKSPEWNNTAVIILYDDSDGWYDHQIGPIVHQSNVPDDQLLGPGNCGTPKPDETGAIRGRGRKPGKS